ncbi:hypothetical protein MBM_02676 [Drepanopeziza brunnea f. sp. 'multigermtubi' MB_m1]|uniref:Uncharacterized protein n=1 Tax=Marssonina brunnea f. sp. multigermtubi (strain MB_m1) TaxID=1072389 RepID=K1Y2P4_MARBU|nr:uncharacterized protein MBM_02676 [Drepanopeziza brunnea f. sp. 'multigermtubi' MB_m1]EKD19439.1 hypothetical protein MBM_02676 [Drepanopeziza brunnea f. sp. 'multigermtubi' MB_m1]
MASQVHRKPIPTTTFPGSQGQSQAQHHPSQSHSNSADIYNHSRSRTTSSNIFPSYQPQPYQPQQQYPANMQANSYTSRRTPSNATLATMSSGNGPVGVRRGTSQDLRRSTSSRSGNSQPGSYVALMRKQKATVWCDRAQHEDPRLLAQQKLAKARATKEVVGGSSSTGGKISTGVSASLAGSKGVTAKIRHHGKSALVGYSPGDLVGGGVPMRLSASEVENGDSDDDDSVKALGGQYHRRTGSGRSSVGSGRRGPAFSRPSGPGSTGGRWGNTPPSERLDSLEGEQMAREAPGAATRQRSGHFDGQKDGTRSAGSGSSGERADGLSELTTVDAARLASNSLLRATITREKSVKSPDELRRRGSVDDRTMTMSAGRLYIANPDADSD